jgi:UDP:flavonoid glycosyltransferase YjiC (YdhE family)
LAADGPEPRRFLIAAFGDPGHAFPAIALGRGLVARGHGVVVQTWKRWSEQVEREGMRFEPAPEYAVFPTAERPLKPYQAAARAAVQSDELIAELRPDAIVADILTVAGGLAAERNGVPWATLVPHLLPTSETGFPPYSVGARLPRTALGARAWGLLQPLLRRGELRGRDELNGTRERLGLMPLPHTHNGISRQLALIATFPQLEYPRSTWLPSIRITGPLLWEQPFGDTDPPPGEEPLVLVAPSTSQDPSHRMLSAALEGLAGEPVRVLATTNRREPQQPLHVPSNARLVDWVSYARAMPGCAAVVCHAGHGTVARALACGVPVVGCPAAGDMAENAARVAWAGAGVSLPLRFITPRGVRLAVRRVLGDEGYARQARELGEWAGRHDGALVATQALERFVAG